MRIILSIFALLLVFSFIFISIPKDANAQGRFGCCRSVEAPFNVPAGECIGCEGESCLTEGSFCTSEGGFLNAGICISQPGEGAICGDSTFAPGCCVLQPGQCLEDLDDQECIVDEEGIVWAPEESCSVISLCDPVARNVPTLSEWGLIGLAGALGVISFIMVMRRKQVTT